MFTLKFYKDLPDNQEEMLAVSCVEYSHESKADGSFTITSYQKVNDIGVERYVSGDAAHYNCCYVENIAGKVVATYPHNIKSRF